MKLKTAVASVFTLLLFQCASYIPVRILKPAELDIPPVKKVAVMDFDMNGSWSFWYDNKSLSLTDLAVKVVQKQLGMEQETRPDPKTAYSGGDLSTRLISGLVQNGHYTVLERAELNKILDEHKLSMSGLIDENQSVQIGQMAGVEALIIGSGNYNSTDGGEWKEFLKVTKRKVMNADSSYTEIADTTVENKFEAKRTVNMEVTYRIVEVSSGRVVASATNRDFAVFTSVKYDETEAYKTLPDWSVGVQQIVDRLVQRTVLQIAPHYVSQSRKIMGGKSPQMKTALEYAKKDMIGDAKGLWEEVISTDIPKLEKDRIAATYNMGVYWELSGDLDQADQCFETCFKKTGKAVYLNERQRIKARKQEIERLRKQNATE